MIAALRVGTTMTLPNWDYCELAVVMKRFARSMKDAHSA